MSDTEGTPTRAGAWTEKATNEFLLRIIKQYKKERKSINWKTFNMPGRTTKSLQNMWTKVNKQLEELPDGEGGSEPTPVKRVRKKAIKKELGEEGDDEQPLTPVAGKKRAAPKTPKANKRVKKEAASPEDNDDELMADA
ncbi:hypothetical protein N3K66_002060 [Trichothecium roseum]|uniref:Uncharacterized protein n=1 Tax=Trichothecium roseum TaxID=47278 RepID=A0ACC0VB65_9HYPO|nr:hypothetical protein N3K66_002060 [Trichothecium roseum]